MKKKSKKYFREISQNENFYLSLQELYSTFSIQFIIEGQGKINIEEFEEAVKVASEYCPGSRLKLKNNKYIDTKINPKIIVLDNIDFDGYKFEKINIFKEKIDPKIDVSVKIYLINSNPYRIYFKISHSIMDGKGALIWIENIFKYLRKEKLTEAKSSEIDLSFIKKVGCKNIKNGLKLDKKIFKNKKIEGTYEINWYRLKINDKYPYLVAKISKFLTDYFDSDDNVFLIPVDIRRHSKDFSSTANLTLPIFLRTKKNEKWEDINKRLIKSLNNSEELNINNADLGILDRLPKFLLRILLQTSDCFQRIRRKFISGGIISDLGKIDLKIFSCNSFLAETFYSLPIHQPLVPISIVAAETDISTEIVFAYYKNIFSDLEIKDLSNKLEEYLSGKYIFNEGYNTDLNINKSKGIIEKFKENIEKNKNCIAIIDNNREYSYKELDEKSDKLAYYLKKNNFSNEKYLAICLDRSFEFIISVLAALKLGITFVPLDKSLPKSKILNILEELNNPFCIFDKNNTYFEYENKIYISNYDLEKPSKFTTVKYSENNIAYCIFTSGSTGKPKGVEISNKSIVNYLDWAKNEYKIKEEDRFSLFTSTSVDLTITSYLLPLISGASIEIFKDSVNHITLKEMLNNKKINIIKLTPTHLKLITDLNLKSSYKKLIIVGGENFNYELAKKSQELFTSDCRIINEYGPTEATIGCSFHEFDSNKKYGSNIPIGLPIKNSKIILLDKNQRIVKNGEKGEIYILGICLANGYCNNEKTKDEKFINFNENRAYKTGDYAKVDKNNEFVYLGREDSQIKISGYRVEIGELESKINKFLNIKNSLIINKKNKNNKEVLIAYFTSNEKIKIDKLREYLIKEFPLYMIPNHFVKIDFFPLKIGGKIDIEKLPKVEFSYYREEILETEEDFNSIQIKLRNIWNDILEIEDRKINLDDDFYDLGGDSLSLIKMVKLISSDMEKLDEEEFTERVFDSFDNITIREIENMINGL